jgi:hypothetical protein
LVAGAVFSEGTFEPNAKAPGAAFVDAPNDPNDGAVVEAAAVSFSSPAAPKPPKEGAVDLLSPVFAPKEPKEGVADGAPVAEIPLTVPPNETAFPVAAAAGVPPNEKAPVLPLVLLIAVEGAGAPPKLKEGAGAVVLPSKENAGALLPSDDDDDDDDAPPPKLNAIVLFRVYCFVVTA